MSKLSAEPDSRIRVQVSDMMMIDGIAVRMAMRYDYDQFKIMRFNERGYSTLEEVDPLAEVGVTFQVNHEFGRALLDALLRYYQGSGDYHEIRKDYNNERARVDKLLDALIQSNAAQVDIRSK